LGILGIWQNREGEGVVSVTFLMKWVSGEPCPDRQEVLCARFWKLEDIESTLNVGPTSKVCALLARQPDIAATVLREVNVHNKSGPDFVLFARDA
jgi:hypothetical protein